MICDNGEEISVEEESRSGVVGMERLLRIPLGCGEQFPWNRLPLVSSQQFPASVGELAGGFARVTDANCRIMYSVIYVEV